MRTGQPKQAYLKQVENFPCISFHMAFFRQLVVHYYKKTIVQPSNAAINAVLVAEDWICCRYSAHEHITTTTLRSLLPLPMSSLLTSGCPQITLCTIKPGDSSFFLRFFPFFQFSYLGCQFISIIFSPMATHVLPQEKVG